jgi:hypothetical protein
MNAWQVARLFALLQMSEADAYIGSLEAKTHYFYWRPVTAIRLAADDGNPDTEADPEWEVLGWNPAGPPTPPFWPTPPNADYPSAHAVAGGAGATLLSQFFGKDDIPFSFNSNTGTAARSFSGFSAASRENALLQSTAQQKWSQKATAAFDTHRLLSCASLSCIPLLNVLPAATAHLEDCAHLLLQPELIIGVQHLMQPAAHQVSHCLAVAVDAVVQVTQPEHQVMRLKRINTPAVTAARYSALARHAA